MQALDYLLKPVDRARFDQVLSRMKRRLRQEQPAVTATPREFPARILIDTGARSLFSGPGKDRARTDGTELPCDSQRRRCAPSAGHAGCVCRAARSGAISAHQPSDLVNVDAIAEMRPWFHGESIVPMKDGTELRWTRRFRPGRPGVAPGDPESIA